MTDILIFDTLKIMSKSIISKTSAILIGLSIITISAYPAFAQGRILQENKRIRSLKSASATSPANPDSIGANRIEKAEQRIENIKGKIASKAAALKIKLHTFKDQRKADIAERVNINLNKINQTRTEQMQNHLNRMSSILDKLEARVNQGKPDIKDPAGAIAAIAAARSNIATVSAAVSAQTQKDYTIVLTSESRIRIDVKTQRDKLHADLLTLRKNVINAKRSVANAIRVAKSGIVRQQLREKEGTISGRE